MSIDRNDPRRLHHQFLPSDRSGFGAGDAFFDRLLRQHQRRLAAHFDNEPRRRQPTSPTSISINSNGAELGENENMVRLTVDLPGVRAKDLDVTVDQHVGVLSVSGVRKVMSVDCSYVAKKHKFTRRYAIDTSTVDLSQAKVSLKHGVLTFMAPKKTLPTPFEIPVTEDVSDQEAEATESAPHRQQLTITFAGEGDAAPQLPTRIPHDDVLFTSGNENEVASTKKEPSLSSSSDRPHQPSCSGGSSISSSVSPPSGESVGGATHASSVPRGRHRMPSPPRPPTRRSCRASGSSGSSVNIDDDNNISGRKRARRPRKKNSC